MERIYKGFIFFGLGFMFVGWLTIVLLGGAFIYLGNYLNCLISGILGILCFIAGILVLNIPNTLMIYFKK